MPLRFPALSLFSAPRESQHAQRRFFSSTAARREGSKTHYETLQIPNDASLAEVKKSFYNLSKAHHPDLHPSDPTAAARFVEISSAYATLSVPAKRHAYDLTLPSTHNPSHSQPRSGSYHSSSAGGPAGGRSPSGLSRRRTQFRGPPPSFYRSGGWGTQSAKRAAASSEAEKAQENMAGGGFGPGQSGWGHGNDVPHFDKEGHFRTHEQIEYERRSKRRGMDGERVFRREEERPAGVFGQFLLVAGVLVVTGAVTSFVFERLTGRAMRRNQGEKKKG